MNNEMPNTWVRPPEWLPDQRSVTDNRIGTREEWAAARDELLAREKGAHEAGRRAGAPASRAAVGARRE